LCIDRGNGVAVDISVQDGGTGINPERTAGVGLLSLRERAAELGGTCEVTCPPVGGTLVRARIPFAALDIGSELASA
jgi:signal transduction histidine kinase